MKKLSHRLQEIFNIANTVADRRYIYDLCCDHGHLAYHLWMSHGLSFENVFAIDCAPKVIKSLRERYQKSTDTRFVIQEQFGERVTYLDHSTIIIAGVGAHTSMKIIDHIMSLGLQDIHIILCCHQNIDLLRAYLNEKESIALVDEKLIFDQSKFYELIHIKLSRNKKPEKVSLLGDNIWQNDELSRKYYQNQSAYWNVRRDEKASFYQKQLLLKKEEWGL